jgi:uncharacterized repeat protein (TIGR02543 family)
LFKKGQLDIVKDGTDSIGEAYRKSMKWRFRMRLRTKQVVAVASALTVTFSFTPISNYLPEQAWVVESKADTYGDLSYTVLDDGTVEVTGYTGEDTELEIPSKIGGKSVTSIGDSAFEECGDLISITVPEGVTSIGDGAFSGCSALTNINIPEKVTSIGDYAFNYCISLTSISIPDGVSSIGCGAFGSCISLTSITIPEGITSIGDYAFYWCESLTSITIPEGVTSVGDYAFYWCKSLTSITIPEEVTSIGKGAFAGCSGLKNISVDKNNTEYCSLEGSLYNKEETTLLQYAVGQEENTFIIPDEVTSIGDYAFYWCESLTNIGIPEGVTSIGDYAFYWCESLTSISIPEGVIRIGNGAFEHCSSLTSIMIPAGVMRIEDCTFWNCSSLTSVTISEGVASIGDSAFEECSSLTSVTIPTSVMSIGYGAFGWCESLTSISIQEGVTSIGDYAFQYCSGLTSVTIPESVTSIGSNTFLYYDVENGDYRNLPIIIQGYTDSYAETYAEENEFAFEEIKEIYRVTFTSDGENIDIQTVEAGEKATQPSEPSKNGYAFADWYQGEQAYDFNTEINDNITLYVKWTPVNYAITYNTNGGELESDAVTVYTVEDTVTLVSPTRTGYTFAGWYSDSKFTKEVTAFKKGSTGDITLYAKWTPITYKITYKTNGGTLSSKAVKSYNITKAVTLVKPTKKGYTFAGWYSDSKFKTKVASVKKGSTGNKTLYAKWTKVSVAKATLSKATNVKGKKLAATWKKISGAKGYQISYSANKKFTKSTTVTKSVSKTSYTATKLKKGKTYYVRVRAYKVDSTGVKVYGKWRSVKKVKITK